VILRIVSDLCVSDFGDCIGFVCWLFLRSLTDLSTIYKTTTNNNTTINNNNLYYDILILDYDILIRILIHVLLYYTNTNTIHDTLILLMIH
jgi:hypothetical protein